VASIFIPGERLANWQGLEIGDWGLTGATATEVEAKGDPSPHPTLNGRRHRATVGGI